MLLICVAYVLSNKEHWYSCYQEYKAFVISIWVCVCFSWCCCYITSLYIDYSHAN